MFNRLLKYLTYGNTFCGVEYNHFQSQDIIYATVLKRSKNELVEDAFISSSSLKDLSSKLPNQKHIYLIVNSEKILTKTISGEKRDALKLVYKAFPNITVDDFYFEVLYQNNMHFVSLCRKDYVDGIISEFSEYKFNIIGFSLGHSSLGILQEYLKTNTIYSSNSKITSDNNGILSIEPSSANSEQYNINGITLDNSYLLSFSGALQSYFGIEDENGNINSKIEELVDDYKQTQFYNQFLKFAGLFILAGLLINFLFFNHYFNKANELEQLSELNEATKTRILNLNASVSKKQKMVDDILKNNSSKSSYYTDRIIKELPKSILLLEFNYQPILKRISKEKPIEIDTDVIEVSGTSNDSAAFSNWISELEKYGWIQSVDILQYGSQSSRTQDFVIKISLNND
ncbi:Tfp pilus assembly protein PilN [Winogradskyella wandonensis]|uniref:Tfp pilus assembly protein PilN n=1 Tax=Winogradskyella wandonensis TaxID=1442586 RepID=A0A4R1KV28_9FLAO|nr:hypothetical protein [Winogradskyella wandonensis]TCK68069.1 Tfp pilus assembly protein PilN [Winogradskyella wandonensis]